MKNISQKKIISILQRGGVGVLPTDTLYGLVGSALSKKTVARVYRVRQRNLKKPCIILIHSWRDLALFGVSIDAQTKKTLLALWPGKVSAVLPCAHKQFKYLHRGIHKLAFRVPDDARLKKILKKTGPLIAPSANSEGMPPAQTVTEAQNYFGAKSDFYINGGRKVSKPSTLVALENGKVVVLREGAVKIKKRMLWHPTIRLIGEVRKVAIKDNKEKP